MNESSLTRVNRQQRCPICHHADWCLLSNDSAICMRVEGGRAFNFKNGALGWIHKLKDPLPDYRPQPRGDVPTISVREILTTWSGESGSPPLEELAKALGVSYSALLLLDTTWARQHKAWAFPMRGGDGEYRGIRLRNESGRKWAVKGSKEGVFFAFGIPNAEGDLFVVEGPTDAAAAMSIGLDCVGRPSCYGGVEEIRIVVRNRKFRRVVIIADNDDVGRRGARGLADAMFVPRCILTLPAKDMREFVRQGGGRSFLDFMLANVLWEGRKI